jgi:AcrR family transcriptional regulator
MQSRIDGVDARLHDHAQSCGVPTSRYSGGMSETNRRRRLLDATRQLITTQGYEATSPGDIQRASGVGQGSFYHHFASKADLAAAALDELAREMSRDFDHLVAGKNGTEAVTAYLTAPREALAGCRIGRLAMESSLADERIRRPVGDYFDHLRRHLGELLEPLHGPVPAAWLADLAIATVQGAYVLARATGDPQVMPRATEALRHLITTATTAATPQEFQ